MDGYNLSQNSLDCIIISAVFVDRTVLFIILVGFRVYIELVSVVFELTGNLKISGRIYQDLYI